MKILIISLIILAIGTGIMLSLPPSKPDIAPPPNQMITVVEVSIPHEDITKTIIDTTTPPKEVKVYVDSDMGFYKIRGVGSENFPNITINVNDTVTWINDDSWDMPVYIHSQEMLWSVHEERLLYNYRHLSYTFNTSGIYTIMVKDARRNAAMMVNVV